LSADVHDRVIDAIKGLPANPRPPGCRKFVGSQSDWRIRVGVLYEIAETIRIVRVNRVRHRREVYR
jgi:mRNA interferase RelE/StbE